ARRCLSLFPGVDGRERSDALPGGPALHGPAIHLWLARFPGRDRAGDLARPGAAPVCSVELVCAAVDGQVHAATSARVYGSGDRSPLPRVRGRGAFGTDANYLAGVSGAPKKT